MTAELGGFTGIVAPDSETVRFLRERRGIDFVLEPWMASDEGAAYAQTLRIDCAMVPPMVARPGDPGNGLPLTEVVNLLNSEKFPIQYNWLRYAEVDRA